MRRWTVGKSVSEFQLIRLLPWKEKTSTVGPRTEDVGFLSGARVVYLS